MKAELTLCLIQDGLPVDGLEAFDEIVGFRVGNHYAILLTSVSFTEYKTFSPRDCSTTNLKE